MPVYIVWESRTLFEWADELSSLSFCAKSGMMNKVDGYPLGCYDY